MKKANCIYCDELFDPDPLVCEHHCLDCCDCCDVVYDEIDAADEQLDVEREGGQ